MCGLFSSQIQSISKFGFTSLTNGCRYIYCNYIRLLASPKVNLIWKFRHLCRLSALVIENPSTTLQLGIYIFAAGDNGTYPRVIEKGRCRELDDKGAHSAEAGRLYVGNLPYAITSSQLADTFAEAGPVIYVEIVYDRVTDRSRGFAFVTMAGVEEAKEAIRMFNGSVRFQQYYMLRRMCWSKYGSRSTSRPGC